MSTPLPPAMRYVDWLKLKDLPPPRKCDGCGSTGHCTCTELLRQIYARAPVTMPDPPWVREDD